MKTDIVFPEFAEDGDEKAKVIQWNVQVGDSVQEGEDVLELLTDKATFTVPAPVSGTLCEIAKPVDYEVAVNDVLGSIEHHT